MYANADWGNQNWSLSNDDIGRVHRTWSMIRRNPHNFGSLFYSRLFQLHPEHRAWFRHFNNVPVNQLLRNQDFLNLGSRVTNVLDNIIYGLHDVSANRINLNRVWPCPYARQGGWRHNDMALTQSVFLDVMRNNVNNWTPEDNVAWNRAWNAIWHNLRA
ncbi:hemoglobin subunit alpha-1 [Microplitis demolitor]|uniref:hemoglobin subunit alpha-1 n=1 Tax=Microplitis demolitor TaxID=69319 RepID=UPI0004CCE6E4|nr:hemoglobin subunit alpha-1 [Microplitis demolitor]